MARRYTTKMIAPSWVTELASDIAKCEGVPTPTIEWTTSATFYSGGTTWSGRRPARIRMSAGTDRFDNELVFLHEMAHAVLPHGYHHTARFWATAFRFYREHGLDLKKAWDRERGYKQQATRAAARAGVPEAEMLVETWKSAARTRRSSTASITNEDGAIKRSMGLRPIRRTSRWDVESIDDRELVAVYIGTVYTGTPRWGDGQMGIMVPDMQKKSLESARFNSLSAAAKAITGRSTNGWKFWMLREGDDEA